jgi:hypothetical protein
MHQQEANDYAEMATKFYDQQNYQEALKYYTKALNYYKKSQYKDEEANTLLNMGNVQMELKNYPEALKHYKEALQIFNNENDGLGEGYCLTGIGIIHEKSEDPEQARDYYQQAINKFQSINDTERVAIVHTLIASTYESQGSWEDALHNYQKSTKTFRKTGDHERLQVIAEKTEDIKGKRLKFKISLNEAILLLLYLSLLIIAESSILFNNVQAGLSLEAVILFILLINSSITKSNNFSILLRSMMALPIIRIIGLSIPLLQIPPLYWFPIIAVPLFATSYTIIRAQSLSRRDVGLILGNIPVQFLIAITGIFLGTFEYLILQPKPLIPTLNLETLLFASIILIISTGLAEELLFRGILQKNAQNVLGPLYGLLYTALLFTALHIGWNSIYDLIFVFSVGLFYGYAFYKTKSIIGVTFSHGISNTFLFLIVPFYAPILYSLLHTLPL